MKFTVRLDLPEANQIVKKLGLGRDGDVQKWYTNRVLKSMVKYMPMDSGNLIQKTQSATNANINAGIPEIKSPGPYAHYLFMGILYVDPITGKGAFFDPNTGRFWSRPNVDKIPSEKKLKYNQEGNKNAGARWDLATVANDGAAIIADLKKYIRSRR